VAEGGAGGGTGAETREFISSRLEVFEAAVRCRFAFLGGGLGWRTGSVSSRGLPRRALALRFLEAVLPLEGSPVVSAVFRAFSAAAVLRAAERVCLGDIEMTLDDIVRSKS
jgi:hypothetical protein